MFGWIKALIWHIGQIRETRRIEAMASRVAHRIAAWMDAAPRPRWVTWRADTSRDFDDENLLLLLLTTENVGPIAKPSEDIEETL